MRITEGMRQNQVSRSLADLASRQAEAARKASTGDRVGAPSNDPVAAAELVRLSAARARTEALKTSVATARGDAELAEGMLGEAGQLYVRVRELAMQGANDTLSASDRIALADQVAQLKQQLVSVANTRGQHGYLFGGTLTDVEPFTPAGGFVGNDEAHLVEVAAGVTVRANASGAQAFTAAGGGDPFGTLDTLEAALRANDRSATAATLGGIDASREQIESARATAGLLLNRLDTSDAVLSQADLALASREQAVGQADPFQAYTELGALSGAFEQAIAVARIVLGTGGQRF